MSGWSMTPRRKGVDSPVELLSENGKARETCMERSPYQVGIDLGTTYTAAAVCRDGEARPETVALATAGAAVASVVFLAPDGALLVGEPAQRRALSEPRRVVREFKRRIGDGTPLVVGGTSIPADTLSARFVAWVVDEVARREGGPASAITVTHPVEWGEHKRRSFAAALTAEGLSEVAFLTEPQAAAIGYASAARVAPGGALAVYDLGGGTSTPRSSRAHPTARIGSAVAPPASSGSAGSTSTTRSSPTCAPRSVTPGRASTPTTRPCTPPSPGCAASAPRRRRPCPPTPR